MKLYEYVLKEKVISEYMYDVKETACRYTITGPTDFTSSYMRQIPKELIGKVLEDGRRKGVIAMLYLPKSDLVRAKELFVEWLRDVHVESLKEILETAQTEFSRGESMLRRLEESIQADEEEAE